MTKRMMIALFLLLTVLPLGARASKLELSSKPAPCGISGHTTGGAASGGNHNEAACGIAGHYKCDRKDHAKAACGVVGHYNCVGTNHAKAACGVEGHYSCDGKAHGENCSQNAAAIIGLKGRTNVKDLEELPSCGGVGHVPADGLDHSIAPCGHRLCDGNDHAEATCGTLGHYNCDGLDHTLPGCTVALHIESFEAPGVDSPGLASLAAPCGLSGHTRTDGMEHSIAHCGTPGHYNCDGKDHTLPGCAPPASGQAAAPAPCGISGHAKNDGNHAPYNRYDADQHPQCQHELTHHCDACDKDYLCSKSGSHTQCRICKQPWCQGSHASAPCKTDGHRACLSGYRASAHAKCPVCGKRKCDGRRHGKGVCKKRKKNRPQSEDTSTPPQRQGAPCGVSGHYTDDGRNHGQAPCGEHYWCDGWAHSPGGACNPQP